ncbi:MAG: aminotransferase class V-fold PLP-dependent enzyme [Chloroflexi bacterium]|nr:MAG: aminotransferase class V-fold PLP-dependent enzyme [Chloroflexota bacterium]MBL1196698.1 aminotransferase class V-fold PLP-dependent enzyme [Chloroflexota bacterium]NOH13991.1 aminotransferase class V-fold PLP-dependent enzyme [Chloroflexota bacterium]
MATPHSIKEYTELFVGTEVDVPLLDGTTRRYINFDNAASTPPMQAVLDTVDEFMEYYSSVHRGTGFKSQLATHAYEEARQIVTEFLGADVETHVCIFGKNSTEALNKLARRFPFTPERDVVITSAMEHHSNDLPWREVAETVHVRLHPNGLLDLEDFDAQLEKYGERIALVAINGGSNVSGFINPIHDLAEKAHAIGAHIAVDCAQLAPHRSVNMGTLDDPRHIDYAIISAHKMYAPYGTGALVGRLDTFERGKPDMVGGGVVEIVTLDEVHWAEPPDRDEAGSPNVGGAVALAAAIRELKNIGMDAVAAHEAELTEHALTRMAENPNIKVYADAKPERAASRLGVIPFQIEGMDHFLVAAILGHEFGIGVRNGCFCAHPLILHLLGLSEEEANQVRDDMLEHNKAAMPGLIRASFGLYNTTEEVDILVDALEKIANGEYDGEYKQDVPTGEYTPKGWAPDFDKYFSLR